MQSLHHMKTSALTDNVFQITFGSKHCAQNQC